MVTNVPGCRQAVINNETGWLCEPKNTESLTKTLEKVGSLTYEELSKAGKAARMHAERHFSEQLVIDEYLKCLD